MPALFIRADSFATKTIRAPERVSIRAFVKLLPPRGFTLIRTRTVNKINRVIGAGRVFQGGALRRQHEFLKPKIKQALEKHAEVAVFTLF